MRIAIAVEYEGHSYHGWQAQGSGVPTVQAELEKALGKVANHRVELTAAGRTDAGVHASAQVAHFDTPAKRPNHSWVLGANSQLPQGIAVRWATPVPETFHARFSARARRYRYLIYTHPARPGLFGAYLSWQPRSLAVAPMRAAARYLLGEHDFSAFRAAGCQARSPVRRLHRLEVSHWQRMVMLDVEANAFLHHMVRNIAGVLMAVGTGKAAPEWAGDVLASRDRRAGGVTAPANGLYLVAVSYPPAFELPTVPLGPYLAHPD